MQDKSQNARGSSKHPRCIKTEGFGPNLLGLSNMTHGSEAHKTLFCQTFIDSHRSFEPETLPWPILDASTIDRLRSIPFWPVALAAERNAGKMVSGFAGLVSDPLIHQALAVQGIEETRHARLLEYMLAHYSVAVDEQPGNVWKLNRRSFIDFGYEECIDAFFGFGIFGLARQIQLFIPELTDIFEVILIEEARHVTFFVNWIAYERAHRHLGSLPASAAATALGYARAVRRIVATFAPTAAQQRNQGPGFAAEGAFALVGDITWRQFLRSCISENNRYLSTFDPRLLRPRVLPTLARLALALPAFPVPKNRAAAASSA
jgi:hypothetical protein